jgi:hypothetical protein
VSLLAILVKPFACITATIRPSFVSNPICWLRVAAVASKGGCDRQDLQLAPQDLVDGLAEGRQLPHLGGVGAQAIPDTRKEPTEEGTRLDGHQPVRYLAQDVRGREANKLLLLDPPQQVGAGRAPSRMGLKVIGEGVGIDEHGLSGGEIGEGHGSSGGGGKSSSGSVANRSASSALPFQPQMP